MDGRKQLAGNRPAATAEAFDAVLARCRPELFNYLGSRVHDDEVAADLVQETYSRAMKYRDDPALEDARLMLFRIANNLFTDYVRHRRRHHANDHVPLEEAGPLPADDRPQEDRVAAEQALATLKRTITELPPKCRLAFTLSRFEGLSNAQVAQKLEISVKMVEKHITRALIACRDAVGQADR